MHFRINGEGEDPDKEDRQRDGEAGDVFQEEEGTAEEGGGALDPLRRRGRPYHLLVDWQALRVLELQVVLKERLCSKFAQV